MNRPPSNCPECNVLLDEPIPAWAYNPNWRREDGPQFPWGVQSRLHTRAAGSEIEDQGIALVMCPDCKHQFQYQAWERTHGVV